VQCADFAITHSDERSQGNTERRILCNLQDDYFAAYRSLKLTRDASGVLVVEFHSNGGPFTFTAQDHTEFVDAFYRIAQDRANKIVILIGAGGEFIPEIDFSSFGNVADRRHEWPDRVAPKVVCDIPTGMHQPGDADEWVRSQARKCDRCRNGRT
jgi:hypothetical protein